jgi:hypothetical protein
MHVNLLVSVRATLEEANKLIRRSLDRIDEAGRVRRACRSTVVGCARARCYDRMTASRFSPRSMRLSRTRDRRLAHPRAQQRGLELAISKRLLVGTMHKLDSQRWRLRAVEYRALADGMREPSTRLSYEAMADQCEKIAEQVITPAPRRLTAIDCLGYAEQCEALARQIAQKAGRERVLNLAEQWRKLAAWGDPTANDHRGPW